MRSIADIEADILATLAKLEALKIELRSSVVSERDAIVNRRRDAILADFDAGHERKTICFNHNMDRNTLGQLLFKNGRSSRKRRQDALAALSPAQAAEYRRLVNNKRAGCRAALRIAQALHVPPQQQEADHGRQGNSSPGPERLHAA